jgi:hypothetical protein
LELRPGIPGIVGPTVINHECFGRGHCFEHPFARVNPVFKLHIIFVGGLENAADPCNDSIPVPHEPGDTFNNAIFGFLLNVFDDIQRTE